MENININELINTLSFANITWQLIGSLIFILADVLSGVISALIQKNLDSQKMREGLLRKTLLIIVIALSFVIDLTFNITVVSKVVCIYIIVMEVISILENLKKAGIDLGRIGELLKIKKEQEKLVIKIEKEGENTDEKNN